MYLKIFNRTPRFVNILTKNYHSVSTQATYLTHHLYFTISQLYQALFMCSYYTHHA